MPLMQIGFAMKLHLQIKWHLQYFSFQVLAKRACLCSWSSSPYIFRTLSSTPSFCISGFLKLALSEKLTNPSFYDLSSPSLTFPYLRDDSPYFTITYFSSQKPKNCMLLQEFLTSTHTYICIFSSSLDKSVYNAFTGTHIQHLHRGVYVL